MFDAVLWGLVQGITEFLPISSSGHLLLIPELLNREAPSLATAAILHLGTLIAVLAFFRQEVRAIVTLTPEGKQLLRLMAIGTVPAAVVGLILNSQIKELEHSASFVSLMLMVTGLLLLSARFIRPGNRTVEDSSSSDALTIGIAQAIALIPGLSRSGFTILPGLAREFGRAEAARYAFLLGIPAIAGAGLLQFIEFTTVGTGVPAETWIGVLLAAVSGYAAIGLLLRLIRRTGLTPFGVYCILAGVATLILI